MDFAKIVADARERVSKDKYIPGIVSDAHNNLEKKINQFPNASTWEVKLTNLKQYFDGIEPSRTDGNELAKLISESFDLNKKISVHYEAYKDHHHFFTESAIVFTLRDCDL